MADAEHPATALEPTLDPAERIILALDRGHAEEALALAAAVPELRWVKVGLELFTAAGPGVVRELRQRGLRVFLDLKFTTSPPPWPEPAEVPPAWGPS